MRITVAYKKVVVGRSLVCQDVVRMPVAFTSNGTINSLTVLILRPEQKTTHFAVFLPSRHMTSF